MKRSFLENLLNVIEDESTRKSIIDSIINENGNDINAEKAKTESAKNELSVKQSLIDELNTKIKENESLDLDKIKLDEYNRGKEEGSKAFDDFKKNKALENSIKGAKDFDLVMSKLDKEKIKYEKNEKGEYSVTGVDEQLEDVRKNYSYLFNEEPNTNDSQSEVVLGGDHTNPTKDDGLAMLERAMGIQDNAKK